MADVTDNHVEIKCRLASTSCSWYIQSHVSFFEGKGHPLACVGIGAKNGLEALLIPLLCLRLYAVWGAVVDPRRWQGAWGTGRQWPNLGPDRGGSDRARCFANSWLAGFLKVCAVEMAEKVEKWAYYSF
jgi:hypothetical protein